MFNNNTFFHVMVCCAIAGLIVTDSDAGESTNMMTAGASTDTRYLEPRHEVIQVLRSHCRRYGIVWSGGKASRFSERIRPRPVRTRWQRDGESRIRCADVDAFRQQRVSDRPSIR